MNPLLEDVQPHEGDIMDEQLLFNLRTTNLLNVSDESSVDVSELNATYVVVLLEKDGDKEPVVNEIIGEVKAIFENVAQLQILRTKGDIYELIIDPETYIFKRETENYQILIIEKIILEKDKHKQASKSEEKKIEFDFKTSMEYSYTDKELKEDFVSDMIARYKLHNNYHKIKTICSHSLRIKINSPTGCSPYQKINKVILSWISVRFYLKFRKK